MLSFCLVWCKTGENYLMVGFNKKRQSQASFGTDKFSLTFTPSCDCIHVAQHSTFV